MTTDIDKQCTNFLFVRNNINEPNLKISFKFKEQLMELNRERTDCVSKTLQRITLKISGGGGKRKKNKKNNAASVVASGGDSSLVIHLLDTSGNECKSETLSNEQAFVQGNQLNFVTKDSNSMLYNIIVNAPTVLDCKLTDNLMAGFLIYPELDLDYASSQHCSFLWSKALPESSEWLEVGKEMIYTPTTDDIGFNLKMTCFAGNENGFSPISKEFVFKETVSAGPGHCIFDQRHLYTKKAHSNSSDELRLVCYNILADIFTTSEFARNTLFPYAPGYVLSLDYRKSLIAKELIGYNADFISLQECGSKLFSSYLRPVMELHGYSGSYFGKAGEMPEGEALFYRTERYQEIEQLSISIREALYFDCNSDILSALTEVPDILENFHKKAAIGQIHIFQEKENPCRQICILNTHLYYKRFSQHVRLMQMGILLNYLATKIDLSNTSLIVNGDLNSLRDDDLLHFLSGDEMRASLAIWQCIKDVNSSFSLSLQAPFKLMNASGCPPFTSYVPHCKETLDYIFCDESFEVLSFIPLPEAESMDPYVGLPCVESPSDHLALVIDLKWKRK